MQNNTSQSIIAANTQSTVVAEYIRNTIDASSYQSEAQLEQAFIAQLENQAYEYTTITTEQELVTNLRKQLEALNHYAFSDNEWEQFFRNEIANSNQSIEEKTATIQEDYIKNLKRDNGSTKNIYLIDKKAIHNNTLQVINQYATEDGQRANRYDVTVLVNGLPLVHIELKRRGVAIQEAFNQINRYQRESFWAASGLFEYVQLFVISNGTHTKYYSNTTRKKHVKESQEGAFKKGKQSSNSFEFTSWWADANNTPIMDLMDFAKTFFAQHTLLNILTKYCIFTSDRDLLVMRPYQIVATESILNRIEISTNYKQLGTVDAGGYVWHTTGSGKTVTSFKTAQLASQLEYIDKVLFVVDRKDLDYQTMKEYDKFAKGAANSNTSTSVLKQQLEDPKARIIITTIQKLDRFVRRNEGHTIFDGHVVIIFDECHRSQFGDMHNSVIRSFRNYHIFGFTGTPIFASNSASAGNINLRTTEQAFGEKLHTYTIVDAIADKNVLPFKVDYVPTVHEAENIEDKKVNDIDRESVLASPERIRLIVRYIREHFDQKTKRNVFYKIKDRRLAGFNSILAVASIDTAKLYYTEFKSQMANLPSDQQLKIATIYSYGVNDDVDSVIDESPEDISGLSLSNRDFLDNAITDYNTMFGTSWDTSADKFQGYYKDLSQKVKDREIDILIVVNMFLTGFDATTLNTLWVDKNLQTHGLLQAYSRTNRILNSVKTFGNIVCFRNLEKATNQAIALFGDKEAGGVVLLKSYQEYYNGYAEEGREVKGYKTIVEDLLQQFPIGQRIASEEAERDFVRLMSALLRVQNILSSFDQFEEQKILGDRQLQDYLGIYNDLRNEWKQKSESEKENINSDIVFEIGLVKQVEVNIDYVLDLIKKYHESNTEDKEVLADITRAINSSFELRNKKELISQFISTLDVHTNVQEDWHSFIEAKKIEELDTIITAENLDHDATYRLIANAFRDGGIVTTGTMLATVLPPVSRFSPGGERTKKRESVLAKLINFFEKFFDISSGDFRK